jgi:hypothetical protein
MMRFLDILRALAGPGRGCGRPDDPEAVLARRRLQDAFWGFAAALAVVLAYCMARWLVEV